MMARPSKRRPWVVEINPPATNGWFEMEAFPDRETADANAALMQRRAPEAKFRIRNIFNEANNECAA